MERVEQRDESRTPQPVMLVGVTPRVVRVALPEAETPRNAIVRIYVYTYGAAVHMMLWAISPANKQQHARLLRRIMLQRHQLFSSSA